MKRTMLMAAAATLLSAPAAFADAHGATGDAAAGETAFRQCIACHVVTNDDGETLAGRNGRTGPNLYNIAGGVYGSVEGFRYSPGVTSLNEAETMITEASFVSYVMDPTAYIREVTGDGSARGAMTFRVRSEDDARDLYAYLVSLAPAAE